MENIEMPKQMAQTTQVATQSGKAQSLSDFSGSQRQTQTRQTEHLDSPMKEASSKTKTTKNPFTGKVTTKNTRQERVQSEDGSSKTRKIESKDTSRHHFFGSGKTTTHDEHVNITKSPASQSAQNTSRTEERKGKSGVPKTNVSEKHVATKDELARAGEERIGKEHQERTKKTIARNVQESLANKRGSNGLLQKGQEKSEERKGFKITPKKGSETKENESIARDKREGFSIKQRVTTLEDKHAARTGAHTKEAVKRKENQEEQTRLSRKKAGELAKSMHDLTAPLKRRQMIENAYTSKGDTSKSPTGANVRLGSSSNEKSGFNTNKHAKSLREKNSEIIRKQRGE